MNTKMMMLGVLLWLLPLQACYSQTATHYQVRPEELQKVNGSYSTFTRSTSSQDVELDDGDKVSVESSLTTADESVRHFVTPDGRALELRGCLNVVVEANGQRETFQHPVVVEISGRQIHIHGRNSSASYVMEQIDYAGVEKMQAQLSRTSWIVVVAITFVGLLGMGG